MATYAIGDIQGCYSSFMTLLDEMEFNPHKDTIWLTGDLVNRGPQSLETLRTVIQLGHAARTVLGNHDLHLLGVAQGLRKFHPGDTFDDILSAPDSHELLDWLRHQPLLIREDRFAMIHAGLLPQWSMEEAATYAAEVETALQGKEFNEFLSQVFGNEPHEWSNELKGYERLRVIVNAFTRLRFCTPAGKMEFAHKGDATQAPPGFMPWFDIPGRRSIRHTLIFGHWSTLGLIVRPNLYGLDTGCLWGQSLTAVCLDNGKLFAVNCASERKA
ncbi:MAG: symmetrical bis(5'-nucleosyl)-tetraphosphatase [Pseudomonadota bacterium]|nr:symmetrical bis(5'-nucleosyl)-tetraphosphatase [Pseudomonadota bacterium]